MPYLFSLLLAGSLVLATIPGACGYSAPDTTSNAPQAASMAATDSMTVDLDAHRWQHRLLFVFARSMDAPLLQEQRSLWANHVAGFADRDLRIYTIAGAAAGTYRESPGAEGRTLTHEAARGLRDRYDVPVGDYSVVLVGKDGTEKRRDRLPVDAEAIFDTIDAMPMRRSEMRRSGNGE